MSAEYADFAAEPHQPCDEWLDLVTAADCAGRWAARRLACCCSRQQLARGGSVSVHVEPADSPVVTWLGQHSYGFATSTGLLIPSTVTAEALRPASWAVEKSRSLLVRRAYAAAFCTVLAEEAGVAGEICLTAEPAPLQPRASAGSRSATAARTGQGRESDRTVIA